MSQRRLKGFQDSLFLAFLVCAAAAAALYFVVRPADLSTSQQVIGLVKTLGVASVVIFIAAAGQVPNLLPAERQIFRPVIWGLLLALTMAAALAVPVVILAFGYFSVKALILLFGLVTLELVLFIVFVMAKADPPVPDQLFTAPAIPAETLTPEAVAQYEAATLALEQATREHEEATMEADELARQYEARL